MSKLKELVLAKKFGGGDGGGGITTEQLNAAENGTYTAPSGKAYTPVVVNVPGPTLVTKTITENGTYAASSDNADGYSEVTVNVAGGGGGGVKTETGSFYVTASGGEGTHTITHSLNTDKVFGILWAAVEEKDTLTQKQGYELFYMPFIAHSYPNDLYSGATLSWPDTSSSTKTATYTNEAKLFFSRYRGAGTSQAASWGLSSLSYQCVSEATANSITFSLNHSSGSNNAYFARYVTYYWKLWALE